MPQSKYAPSCALRGFDAEDGFWSTGVNELFARNAAVRGLARSFGFLRVLWRGFPARTLEQAETETNGYSEV